MEIFFKQIVAQGSGSTIALGNQPVGCGKAHHPATRGKMIAPPLMIKDWFEETWHGMQMDGKDSSARVLPINDADMSPPPGMELFLRSPQNHPEVLPSDACEVS